jgi:hypothetical protein
MDIKFGWALAAGVAVGGAVAWWQLGHPGWQTMDQKVAAAEQADAAAKNARHAAEPALYRWRDANGVLQLTDKPPKGRKYEKVRIREDQNIIPMSELASPRTHHAPN